MRKRSPFTVWCFGFVALLSIPAMVEAAAFKVNARSALLMDMTNNRVLYEQNADAPIAPASVTKVLTLYLVLDSLRNGRAHLTDMVLISAKAANAGGSRMHVRAGETVPVHELIKGTAIISGNDAAVALAEYIGGSTEEFVRKMNLKARELGMTHSHFVNPNGLPAEGQLTTARDIGRLSVAYLKRFPESLIVHSMSTYSYNNYTHRNANRLLGRCPGVDGLKTGFVCAAGYNISATAERSGVRLLAVVLGAPSPGVRAAEATKLLESGFDAVTQGATELRVVHLDSRGERATGGADDDGDEPAAKCRVVKKTKVERVARASDRKAKTAKSARGQKLAKSSVPAKKAGAVKTAAAAKKEATPSVSASRSGKSAKAVSATKVPTSRKTAQTAGMANAAKTSTAGASGQAKATKPASTKKTEAARASQSKQAAAVKNDKTNKKSVGSKKAGSEQVTAKPAVGGKKKASEEPSGKKSETSHKSRSQAQNSKDGKG